MKAVYRSGDLYSPNIKIPVFYIMDYSNTFDLHVRPVSIPTKFFKSYISL